MIKNSYILNAETSPPSPYNIQITNVPDPQNPDTILQLFQNGSVTEKAPYSIDVQIVADKRNFGRSPQIILFQ